MSDLFDAAAERLAITTDIPLSQARIRVAGCDVVAPNLLFERDRSSLFATHAVKDDA